MALEYIQIPEPRVCIMVHGKIEKLLMNLGQIAHKLFDITPILSYLPLLGVKGWLKII